MQRKTTGWSIRGKPFSQREYSSSYLKSGFGMSYSEYLKEYERQYKKKSLRKYL